jgi:hypothetical protein
MLHRRPDPGATTGTHSGGPNPGWASTSIDRACVGLPKPSWPYPRIRGFFTPELACQVRNLGGPAASHYGRRQASYDLKKFRANKWSSACPARNATSHFHKDSRFWRLCWLSVTKSSSHCWPLPSKLGRRSSAPNPYSTNSASRHEHEKQFFQVLSLSA